MADEKPIIVIKKKGGHGGHHGGAWKVAYADFVTAMMAFFLVMWLVNTADQSTKQNIAKYFRQPGLFDEGSGTPLLIGEGGILDKAFVPQRNKTERDYAGKGEDKRRLPPARKDDKEQVGGFGPVQNAVGQKHVEGEPLEAAEPQAAAEPAPPPSPAGAAAQAGGGGTGSEQFKLRDLAARVADIIKAPELKEALGKLDVRLDSDGLLIEIMDTDQTSMFASGSASITPAAQEAFVRVADLLAPLSNKIDVIGHTDAKPYSTRRGYGNWELSSDRANAARRLLETAGIPETRLAGVVGRAARDLRNPADPLNIENRRITLKVRFDDQPRPAKAPTADTLRELQAPPPQDGPQVMPVKDSVPASAAQQQQQQQQQLAAGAPPAQNQALKRPKKWTARVETAPLPDKPVKENPPPPEIDELIFKHRPVLGANEPFFDF